MAWVQNKMNMALTRSHCLLSKAIYFQTIPEEARDLHMHYEFSLKL